MWHAHVFMLLTIRYAQCHELSQEERTVNEERRIAQASERMETYIEELLARVHDASGSVITANTSRLSSLCNLPEALARCRLDSKVTLVLLSSILS